MLKTGTRDMVSLNTRSGCLVQDAVRMNENGIWTSGRRNLVVVVMRTVSALHTFSWCDVSGRRQEAEFPLSTDRHDATYHSDPVSLLSPLILLSICRVWQLRHAQSQWSCHPFDFTCRKCHKRTLTVIRAGDSEAAAGTKHRPDRRCEDTFLHSLVRLSGPDGQ